MMERDLSINMEKFAASVAMVLNWKVGSPVSLSLIFLNQLES